MQASSKVVLLDGESLSIDDLVSIESPDVQVQIPDSAWKKVREGNISNKPPF
jgi:histidine ammonia-lyase